MTDETLREIEQRCAAAAPGPWKKRQDDRDDDSSYQIYKRTGAINNIICGYDFGLYEQDADFIAHARADVAALVQECRVLQRSISVTREALRMAMTNDWNNDNDSNGGSSFSIDERMQIWLDEANAHLFPEEDV
jgi:hypothetical protein